MRPLPAPSVRAAAPRASSTDELPSRLVEAREDAAGLRAAVDRVGLGVAAAQLAPRADEDPQRLVGGAAADVAAPDRDVERDAACRRRPCTAAPSGSTHSTRTGSRLPSLAVHERLGVGADDRADVRRHAPVVVIPPQPVAAVDVDRARALVGEDAVDVDEPVDRAPVAAPAGRRRRSTARTRRRSASSTFALRCSTRMTVSAPETFASGNCRAASVAPKSRVTVSPTGASGSSPAPTPQPPIASAAHERGDQAQRTTVEDY